MSEQASLVIKQTEIGPLRNFLYVIADTDDQKAVIVDPAWDVPQLLAIVKTLNCDLEAVWLTHGHPDHVNGLDELLAAYDVPVFISEHEADYYTPQHANIEKVPDKAQLNVGNIPFICLHTPGHTPGGQCFYHEPYLIAGDTIFIDGCGRCDLPGGDAATLFHSLKNTVSPLPDNTVLYTGHNYGPKEFATLAEQKTTNPYLQCQTESEFVHDRMGM